MIAQDIYLNSPEHEAEGWRPAGKFLGLLLWVLMLLQTSL